MTDKLRRRLVSGAAAGLSTALAVTLSPGLADAAPPPPPAAIAVAAATSPIPQSEWCARPLSRLELYRGSSNFDADTNSLTLLDETLPIDLNTFAIGASPFTDVSRVLWYRSLLWLAIASADFHEKGQDARAEQMAKPMIRAAEEFPDPGSATPELTAISNGIGWDEGTAFRRAEALLCLSSYTGVDESQTPLGPRVAALLRMHADALVDPNRYKGPPLQPVHNHGMLANLTLLDIADRLNEPSYRRVAIDRLVNDSTQVFSPMGWSFEGSTLYQSVNVTGWRDAADAIRRRGEIDKADFIEAQLVKARDAVAHLVSPTDQIAAIGNSRLNDAVNRPAPNPSRPLQFVDTVAGVATGRWSWTDPQTTWWTALNRDRTGAHGHNDNQAITWQALGVPALIDIGQYDYDDSAGISKWMSSAAAHNRALTGTTAPNDAKLRTLVVKRKGALDRIEMDSTDRGPVQRRTVLVDNARHNLEVTDTSTGRLTQYWHLSPGWVQGGITPSSIRFTGPGGRVLNVTTSPGAVLKSVPSGLNPIAGLVATGFKEAAAAPEFRTTGDASITTTFQMYAAATDERVLPPLTVTPEALNGKTKVKWSWPAITPEPDPKSHKTPTLTARQKAQLKEQRKAVKLVRGYRVQFRHPLFGWITAVEDNGSAKKMATRIRKMTNGEKYLIRVAPLTKNGQGPYSEPAEVIPLSTPDKSTAPQIEMRGKRASISWTPPLDDGGAAIRRYTLTVGQQEIAAKRAHATLPKGLEPGTTTILVRAENSVGVGKPMRVKVLVKKDGTVKLA